MSLLALALAPVLASAAVYRWVGPDGTVHFGDTPQPGAEEVHIAPPQTYSPPAMPPAPDANGAPDPNDAQPAVQYQRLELTAPEPDSSIWENTGAVRVRFVIDPPLDPDLGHQIEVLVDGEARAKAKGTEVLLENLDRGTHSLQGRVVDAAGEILITSSPVTVHMHRQSVHLPNRARPQPR